jgi:hypothetical protein
MQFGPFCGTNAGAPSCTGMFFEKQPCSEQSETVPPFCTFTKRRNVFGLSLRQKLPCKKDGVCPMRTEFRMIYRCGSFFPAV